MPCRSGDGEQCPQILGWQKIFKKSSSCLKFSSTGAKNHNLEKFKRKIKILGTQKSSVLETCSCLRELCQKFATSAKILQLPAQPTFLNHDATDVMHKLCIM